MINFWYFIPKSGIAFIFLSVILIFVWNVYRNYLDYPYLWVIGVEIGLFFICFYGADRESRQKLKKS